MFKCGNCQRTSQPGDKPVRIVLETRQHRHPPRYRPWDLDADGYPRPKTKPFDPGGWGEQIVREADFCKPCAEARATS